MNESEDLYLSIVVSSRNDNHGGDMRKRMTIFINGLIYQCNKYKLPAEIVFVDWNSPNEDDLLFDVLPKPSPEDYLRIRYIVVPENEHAKFQYSDKIPLFQMIAKNVGIRRSKAPFVLCTNVDLLFSDELFEILAKRSLEEGKFYRANRSDIPNDIDSKSSVANQLIFCKNNVLKVLGKDRRFPIIRNDDGFLMRNKIFTPLIYPISWLKRIIAGKDTVVHRLDLDACGDFTLMSKSDWIKIDGYAELEMYSIHIDSMGLMAASALGIEQVLLPKKACAYHISHTGGWEFANPFEKLRFFENKPCLDWRSVWSAGMELNKTKSNFDINDENWGLNDVILKEIKA
ncbi:MAG: hypothetical protein ACI857_001041 [Arenicella sp.]|jgi:hypothetical protein